MKEMIQFQMMQLLNPQIGQTKGTGDMQGLVYVLLLQLVSYLVMTLVDQLSTFLPALIQEVKAKYVNDPLKKHLALKTETLADSGIQLGQKHENNTIIVIRKWDLSNKSSDSSGKLNVDESAEIADALLECIAAAENVPCLQLIQSSQFIITYKDKPVEIMPGIFVKVERFAMKDDTLRVDHIMFRVTSNIHSTVYIRQVLEKLRRDYVADQQNKLGDRLWYFEQRIRPERSHPVGGKKNTQARMERVLNAPPIIQYEMRPFHSNKRFNNLFGEDAKSVRDRVDFFLENKAWYAKKGIPYQLGLLLSGKPGSGKTAIIRAMANRTKRHIINLKLSNLATATQLRNVFFNDYICVPTDDSGHDIKRFFIPPEKRIYVFEEIDTVGSLVQDRENQSEMVRSQPILQDELTLGDILQILDGTIEIPGRILIMTSNFPERLDRALLRPGRLDLRLDFGYASAKTVSEIIKGVLEIDINAEELPDAQLTPAEVLNIIFTFLRSTDDIHKELTDRLRQVAKERKGNAEPCSQVPRLPYVTPPPSDDATEEPNDDVAVCSSGLHESNITGFPETFAVNQPPWAAFNS